MPPRSRFGTELCQQHIPSEAKEGGRALAGRGVHGGCPQHSRVGAGTGTRCLPLVALSQVLPKHTSSPASAEGCKPGKDPMNLQAARGLICTFLGMMMLSRGMGRDAAR